MTGLGRHAWPGRCRSSRWGLVGLSEAKAAGELLAATGTSDAVDGLVAVLARPGDQVLTGNPGDLARLVAALPFPVTVVLV